MNDLIIPTDINFLWEGMTPGIEQVMALEMAAKNKVMVLTGGPGAGKTRVTSAILNLFEANNLSTTCLAPTGKAAIRMAEQTGRPASTIHRAINPINGRPTKELTSSAVIVDESSMLEVEIAAALLLAMNKHQRLIFVGDVSQLPSVGPGRVLADIISSGQVPVARLTHIYRQASESRIPYVARDINEGRSPDLSLKGTDVSHIEVPSEGKGDEERAAQLANIQALVVKSVTQTIPAIKGIPTTQIQVLCAQRNRAIGVEEMNRVLQNAINPLNSREELWIGGGYCARVGDRVMQVSNNYDFGPGNGEGEGVMNGEIGIVEELNSKGFLPDVGVWTSFRQSTASLGESEEGSMKASKPKGSINVILVVRFEVGKDVKRVGYTKEEVRDLRLAYACSVHKFQGSQVKAVVMPVHPTHNWMLTRKLVYTAITRAESFFLSVGEANSIFKAARNPKGDERRTSLQERLRGIEGVVETVKAPAKVEEPVAVAEVSSPPTSSLASYLDQLYAGTLEEMPVEDGDAAVANIEASTESPASSPSATALSNTPNVVRSGHYYVNGHQIKIDLKAKGALAGKMIVSIKDRLLDEYKGVAFVNNGRINPWKAIREDLSTCNLLQALESDPNTYARLYAEKTGRCIVCAKVLDDAESVERGMGPKCWKKWNSPG